MTLIAVQPRNENKIVEQSWTKQLTKAIRLTTSAIGVICVESIAHSLFSKPVARQFATTTSQQSSCIANIFTGAVGSITTTSPLPLALGTLSCASGVAASEDQCMFSDCKNQVVPLSEFTPEEQSFLQNFVKNHEYYENMSPYVLAKYQIQGDSIIINSGIDTEKFIDYVKIKFAESIIYDHKKIRRNSRDIAGISNLSPLTADSFFREAEEKQYSDKVLVQADPILKSYFSEEKKIEDRSIEERMACFNKLRELGKKRVKRAKGKDIVIFFGTTGAGKSTLIDFLIGCKMERVVNDRGIPHIKVSAASEKSEVTEIVSSTISGTILPKSITIAGENLEKIEMQSQDKNNEGSIQTGPIELYDLPGISDSRGFEVALANICNIMELIKTARSVKVVLVAKDKDLQERGNGWKNIVKLLNTRFENKLNASNLHVVITDAQRDIKYIKNDIAQYAKVSSSIPDLSQCATIYNPTNEFDREVQLRLIRRNFDTNLSNNVVLTADEAQQAKTLTKDMSELLIRHFANNIELKKVVAFANNLKILNNSDLIEALTSIETTLSKKIKDEYSIHTMPTKRPEDIDGIWKKYSMYNNTRSDFEYFMSFDSLDKEMSTDVSAAIRAYSLSLFEGMPTTTQQDINHILAKYSEFKTTGDMYSKFIPFDDLDKIILEKLSDACINYLRGLSGSIRDMSGEKARDQMKKFKAEKDRLYGYIVQANNAKDRIIIDSTAKEAQRDLYRATEKEDIANTGSAIGVTTGIAAGIIVGAKTIAILSTIVAFPAIVPIAAVITGGAGGIVTGLGAKSGSEWFRFRIWPFSESNPD